MISGDEKKISGWLGVEVTGSISSYVDFQKASSIENEAYSGITLVKFETPKGLIEID